MTFDFQSLIPKASTWFSPFIEYQGNGHAEFTDPVVTLEGRTIIQFAENEKMFVSMQLDNVPTDFDLRKLFYHSSASGAMEISIRKKENSPCTKFEVRTPEGIFHLHGRVWYKHDP